MPEYRRSSGIHFGEMRAFARVIARVAHWVVCRAGGMRYIADRQNPPARTNPDVEVARWYRE